MATFIIACYETHVRDKSEAFRVISFPATYSSSMALGMQQAPMRYQPVYIQQVPVQHSQSLPTRAHSEIAPVQPVSQSPSASAVPEEQTENQLPAS